MENEHYQILWGQSGSNIKILNEHVLAAIPLLYISPRETVTEGMKACTTTFPRNLVCDTQKGKYLKHLC